MELSDTNLDPVDLNHRFFHAVTVAAESGAFLTTHHGIYGEPYYHAAHADVADAKLDAENARGEIIWETTAETEDGPCVILGYRQRGRDGRI